MVRTGRKERLRKPSRNRNANLGSFTSFAIRGNYVYERCIKGKVLQESYVSLAKREAFYCK